MNRNNCKIFKKPFDARVCSINILNHKKCCQTKKWNSNTERMRKTNEKPYREKYWIKSITLTTLSYNIQIYVTEKQRPNNIRYGIIHSYK